MFSEKSQATIEGTKAERKRAWYRIGEWVIPAVGTILGLGDDVISVASARRTPEEFLRMAHDSEDNFAEVQPEPDIEEAFQDDLEVREALNTLSNHPALTSGKQMLATKYAQRRFVVEPSLLPKGGRMLLTAENGTGKSVITLYMAACILLGCPLFGFLQTKKERNFGKPIFPTLRLSSALYLDYEIPEPNRAEERLRPLARVLAGDFVERIFFPQNPSDFRLENGSSNGNEGAFDRLLKLVSDTKPGLLVIDPFSSTHSLDENSNQIKQALNNIDRLIDHSGATVILVHHESTKIARDKNGEPIEKGAKERARGHSCLTDWADVHLSIEEIKPKGYHESNRKVLNLTWGKTRYAKKSYDRQIEVNFQTMEVVPRLKTDD